MRTETQGPGAMLPLAELLATRLCHDLAGLCGTLLSAIDLAVNDPQSAADALPLAHETAIELAARLRLMRAAWGPPGDTLDRPALAQMAAGLPGASRLQIDFGGLAAGTSLAPDLSRLALNALLLAAAAMPHGGALRISGNSTTLSLAIEGRRAAWPASLAGLLAEPHTATRVAQEAGSGGLLAPCWCCWRKTPRQGCALNPRRRVRR